LTGASPGELDASPGTPFHELHTESDDPLGYTSPS
jgi:hypothetical protein